MLIYVYLHLVAVHLQQTQPWDTTTLQQKISTNFTSKMSSLLYAPWGLVTWLCYTLEPEQPGSPSWTVHGAEGGDSNAPANEPLLGL